MDSKKSHADERARPEIVRGAEECDRQSIELLEELGFPSGVLPLKDLVECGRVHEIGFVWMKQKAPYEYFFFGSNTLVSHANEVTVHVEKGRMKKITGIKQLLLWVLIVEMSIEESNAKKIYFTIPMGIGRSSPVTAFMSPEDKKVYLENVKEP